MKTAWPRLFEILSVILSAIPVNRPSSSINFESLEIDLNE